MKQLFLCVVLSMSGLMVVSAQNGNQVVDNNVNNILTYIQRAMKFNQTAPQEKVYLHFDNTGYFKGETIRFKAYLTRMDNEQRSNISTVLYVELVNPIGDVCERRTLKIENGEAEGDILLDSIVGSSGFYEVRAFTRYMTNWGTNAVFSRVFPIFNKPQTEGNYENAVIDRVSFRHRLPNTRVDEEGKQAESTTDLVQRSVKFYPEGGHLVKGLKSRVAVSVTNSEGRHLATKGTLMNAQHQKVADVVTDETGRGLFEFTPDGSAYTVHLADEKGKQREYKLPEALDEGCVMTLDVMDDDELTASLQCTSAIQGRLLGYALMHNGNVVQCDTMTAEPMLTHRFDRLSMPDGVSQITIFDSSGQILSERLFFIMPMISLTDSINVTTTQTTLAPCGKVTLDLLAEPNSSISFSAMDAATMTNGKEGNMKTWMLLSSEVSGYIDSPDYYFESDDAEHRKAADLLMMIQGWRRYDWQLMSGKRQLEKVEPNEDGLYMYGKLTHRSKKRDVGNVELSAILFNKYGQSMSGKAVTDSLGRYSFMLPDCEGDWAVQIKSKKEGEAQNYIIGIDRHFSPAMRLLSPYETEMLPVGPCNFFKEKESKPEDEEFVSITKKVHVLPTVKIKRRRLLGDLRVNWYDEKMASNVASVYYDCGIYADEIGDRGEEMPTFDEWLKKKNSLIDGKSDPTFDDMVYIKPIEIGIADESAGKVMRFADLPPSQSPLQFREELYQTSGEKPIICYEQGITYDRRPIIWIVNNMFCTITNLTSTRFEFTHTNNSTGIIERPELLSDVKSIYFTENTSSLKDFIVSTDLEAIHPVIAFVYTYPLFSFKEKGLRKTHFYGYNQPTKFEMEDYSVMPPMEDFRRTLFWDANVKTDEKGHATVEFYNNSSAKQFFVSAEGMSSNGKILISE